MEVMQAFRVFFLNLEPNPITFASEFHNGSLSSLKQSHNAFVWHLLLYTLAVSQHYPTMVSAVLCTEHKMYFIVL